jgi:two-component system response regulator FixJ
LPGDCAIYVVDDDAGVRRSLERLVTTDGFAVTSFDSATFLGAAPRLPVGCILLEVRRPEMDGLKLQGRLVTLGVAHPVVIMTGHGDVPVAVRAIKAGAVDVLEKPYSGRDLLRAIEAALGHKDAVHCKRGPVEAERLIASLSPREREVLNALAAGRSNKLIAFDLGISVRTVEVHRARMMKRLGVRQFAEAIRVAVLATGVEAKARSDPGPNDRAWSRG